MEIIAEFHPLIVHFPIVLFTLYILFEIVFVIKNQEINSKLALLFLLMGVATGIGAVLTGNQAAGLADPDYASLIEEHETFASITVWYFTAILIVRYFLHIRNRLTGYLKYIFLFLALAGLFLIIETGEHGNELVYRHGIGTELLNSNVDNN